MIRVKYDSDSKKKTSLTEKVTNSILVNLTQSARPIHTVTHLSQLQGEA